MEYLSHYRGIYKSVIRCPKCNARHYPTRIDRKHLEADKYYEVVCGCGYVYRIKDLKRTLVISGRRYDDGK